MSCTPFCKPRLPPGSSFPRRRRRQKKHPPSLGENLSSPDWGLSRLLRQDRRNGGTFACARGEGGRYPSDKTKSTDFKSMLSFFGAADEARTRYLHLGKVALYQMSYSRIFNLQVAFLFYPCRGHVALTRFDDSKVSCLPLRRYHSGRNRFRCGESHGG